MRHRQRNGKCGEWLHGELCGFGYRMTAPREAIVEVLSMMDEHPSVEDIYIAVHKKYPRVGLTTVYRTLELLVKMGCVSKFDFGDGRARYEVILKTGESGHHHHLICTVCQKIINYTDFIDEEVKLLAMTEKGLEKKYHFKITNHVIQFYGVCDMCKKEE